MVDNNTILVGHSLKYDLNPLRIQHDRIIDSVIMNSDAVYGSQGNPWYWNVGLKTLCEELLGMNIRPHPWKWSGNQTHDGLKDALATREVVLWFLQNEQTFFSWAEKKYMAFRERQERTSPEK